MGKLIRNGIEYGGGNGTDIFEVTQAEYDALVQAGTLVHNALYVITDAPNLNETADDISYDGSTDTAKDMIDNSLFNEAEPYKNNITYAIGDYCTYKGLLYQCISAIASAEEWTPSHWERTTLTKLQTTTYNVATYGGVIVCLKVGRLVTIKGYNIGSTQNTPTGQRVDLTTIAERYRPRSFTVNVLGFTGGSNNYNDAIGFSVSTTGAVSIYGYSALTAGNFVATYIV